MYDNSQTVDWLIRLQLKNIAVALIWFEGNKLQNHFPGLLVMVIVAPTLLLGSVNNSEHIFLFIYYQWEIHMRSTS